ncbi:hypothetical protein INT44_002196 [Umbelopsis vinacea]|uniref:Mid2 domain-containing protein n=1 Tax=Umbelopsis vinacea TaxID=44442 RepID=A0A8H7UJG5_9FUNG|nr:hypothetical protein INT44_002196 [Umbelopsis vinacea]
MRRITPLMLILLSSSALGAPQILSHLLDISDSITNPIATPTSQTADTSTSAAAAITTTTQPAVNTPTPSPATTSKETKNPPSNSYTPGNNHHESQDTQPDSSSAVATSYQITLPASTVVAWSTNAAGEVFSTQSVVPPSVSVVVSTIYSSSASTTSPVAPADSQPSSSVPSTGVIIGSICAFLAILIAGGVYAFFWKTRRPSNRQMARLYGGEQGGMQDDDDVSSKMLSDDRPKYRTGPAPYYSYAQDPPVMSSPAMAEPRVSMPPRGYVSPELSSQRIPIFQRPNEK